MTDKKPFTEGEQKVMDLLIQAHGEFVKLERGHPSEISDWVMSFHELQAILMCRVTRRDYPEIFR